MSLVSTELEAAAVVTLRPDGSAQVSCGLGSVSIRSATGAELMVLRPNQTVGVSVDGKLQTVEPIVASSSTESTPTPVARGKSRTGFIVLAAAVAGGTAAAIALISRKSTSQPVSPSSP